MVAVQEAELDDVANVGVDDVRHKDRAPDLDMDDSRAGDRTAESNEERVEEHLDGPDWKCMNSREKKSRPDGLQDQLYILRVRTPQPLGILSWPSSTHGCPHLIQPPSPLFLQLSLE